MLTIHQPFPAFKAGVGGIIMLATGFFGTLGVLNTLNPDTTKSPNSSNTSQRKSPEAHVTTTPSSATAVAESKTDNQPAWAPSSAPQSTVSPAATYSNSTPVAPTTTEVESQPLTIITQPDTTAVPSAPLPTPSDTSETLDPTVSLDTPLGSANITLP